jgi:uncharacterized protein YbaR (Trm112 family)
MGFQLTGKPVKPAGETTKAHGPVLLPDAKSRHFSQRRLAMAISKELLDILACPKCKGDIYLNDAGDGLICDNCKLLYEIKDDIPIMLIDEARPID